MCWLSGHRNLFKFRLSWCFPCQLHARTCPLYNVLLKVVVVYIILNMTLIGSVSSLHQVSCLSVPWLVRYAEQEEEEF